MRYPSVGMLLVLASLLPVGRWAAVPPPRPPGGAHPGPPDPAGRTTVIRVPYTEYDWWVTRWEDNRVQCDVAVRHEGLPSALEVLKACGQEAYSTWSSTPPCPEKEGAGSACQGLYLFLAGSQQGQENLQVDLPPVQVWLSLSDCMDLPPRTACDHIPSLVLTAHEPLPNEAITAVHAEIENQQIDCPGQACVVPLGSTSTDGTEIKFWADSTLGDSSQAFTARVRILGERDPARPSQTSYFIDVLSAQWRGEPAGTCAQLWDALPPPGGPPPWLSTPKTLEALATHGLYEYLAGRLIASGLVDVGACPDEGLMGDGSPSPCGLKAAGPVVDAWQDRFDRQILQAAGEAGIPAQLLKNLFAKESQFWPAAVGQAEEFGLGQLSDLGADTALLWNVPFYQQLCTLVLDRSICQVGYARLNATHQAMLRGALLARAAPTCATCPSGVDLTQVGLSVEVFAQTILASCGQVGRMVYNTAHRTPGQVSSYEDLWRFTLASYNAGPGCLSTALKRTKLLGEPLDWPHVAAQLPSGCQSATDYVAAITG